MLIKPFLVSIPFFYSSYITFSQESLKDTSLVVTNSSFNYTLQMNGFLDGTNTFTQNPYTKVFEPMLSVKLTNNGTTKINKPRIVFNNRGRWFTIDLMRNECFQDATTEKEKALAVWKFFKNNRIHDLAADYTDNMNDPIKLLGVYGYGMCYNTNYAMCFLAQPFQTVDYRGYSPQGLHYVSEMDFGDKYQLIDSDIETFYLENDNITIASANEVFLDKNLIRRTQHYGKEAGFDSNVNNYIANLYYPNDPSAFFGYMSESDIHTLDFNLRPGESILYDWTMPTQVHNDGILPHSNMLINTNSPFFLMNKNESANNLLNKKEKKLFTTQSIKDSVVANGEFDFKTNFKNAPLSLLLDYYSNLNVDSAKSNYPSIHIADTSSNAIIILKVVSPFVIVGGDVLGKFIRNSSNDSIELFFSQDSVVWKNMETISQIGNFDQKINLSSFINTDNSNALYSYYLKILISSHDSVSSCGMDSLEVRTQFQVSKFFLPQLVLGNNTIEYSDADSSRNVNLEIKWKESTANHPPDEIVSPLFPQDGSTINNLKFTFSWPIPNDADGNAIVNYEFQLSDISDMKFPLSPTFSQYVSEIDSNNVKPAFIIPKFGLLNDGATYYWRVRAKDSYGAWGIWSPVWSFIPKGAMPPSNPAFSFSNDSAFVSWQQGNGETPAYYEIHGSNEWLGFSPDSSTLIDVSAQTHFAFPIKTTNKLFYRIVAVGNNGEKSGPSEVLEFPYPQTHIKVDSVFSNKVYTLGTPTPLNYSRVNPNTYSIEMHQDSFSTSILSAPSWLSNFSGDSIYGFPDSATAFNLLLDSARGKVAASYTSELRNTSDTVTLYLPSAYINSLPEISNVASQPICGNNYTDTISISDKDIPYGDSLVSIKVLNHPSWMTDSIYKNTLVISGKPSIFEVGDTVVVVSAKDILGNPVEKNIYISIQSNPASVNNYTIDELKIFPNPTNGVFQITNEKMSIINIDIFNTMGEKAYSNKFSQSAPLTINLSDKPNGVYHLHICTPEKSYEVPILKVN